MSRQRLPLHLLKAIQSVAKTTGEDFLRSLAEVFSDVLGMDFFFVGKTTDDPQNCTSAVLSMDGQSCDNVQYTVTQTPCEHVLRGAKPCSFPSSLKQQFPHGRSFYRRDAESYFGVPLFDSKGALLGLMATAARRPLGDTLALESVLNFFAARVGAELERLQIEEKLLAQRRFTQTILDAIPSPIFFKDGAGVYIGCNRAFESFIGLPREKILGETVYGIAPEDLANIYHDADQELLRRGGTQNYETSVRHANGDRREVLFQKAVFGNPDGSVGGLVGSMLDITERKKAEEVARYLSHFDPLTNLPNQVLFTDRLNMEIANSHRLNKRFAIFCLDLDHFKKINNAFGHARADHILRKFAKRLSAFLRQNDTVSRMGGDSFNLLLPDIDQENSSAKIAKRLLEILRQPFSIDDQEIFVNASLGISIYPHDGIDAQTLLKNADTALQLAKEKGRNTLRFFAPEMNARAEERMLTECQLRKALANNEFVLHYQPQVDAETLKMVGVEALVRWRHPSRGLLLPAHFIDLAEETGLIVPLGEWVLRTACAQGRAWRESGLSPLRIGVNLSPRQFQQADLYGTIHEILMETGLKPRHLSLEITEGVVMKDVDHAIQTLARLKQLGVHLSIDDFGTGYSSLSYLKNLPIDMLKIDRSFVMDIPSMPDDMAIVTAVITLAHNLNLKVLAEGVQNDAQKTFLQANRCDELQGYLFGHPVEAKEIRQLKCQSVECGNLAPLWIR
jgi:diguanylate cyclase (GGDEF)-like protein/PAS domain S-box-containing protein